MRFGTWIVRRASRPSTDTAFSTVCCPIGSWRGSHTQRSTCTSGRSVSCWPSACTTSSSCPSSRPLPLSSIGFKRSGSACARWQRACSGRSASIPMATRKPAWFRLRSLIDRSWATSMSVPGKTLGMPVRLTPRADCHLLFHRSALQPVRTHLAFDGWFTQAKTQFARLVEQRDELYTSSASVKVRFPDASPPTPVSDLALLAWRRARTWTPPRIRTTTPSTLPTDNRFPSSSTLVGSRSCRRSQRLVASYCLCSSRSPLTMYHVPRVRRPPSPTVPTDPSTRLLQDAKTSAPVLLS